MQNYDTFDIGSFYNVNSLTIYAGWLLIEIPRKDHYKRKKSFKNATGRI